MRSLAVLVAALIASVFQSVEGADADAAAAVVVSIIIIVSLLPLLHGLYLTAREIIILSKTPIAH
jgi:predicted Na+-dependent transporter